MSLEKAEVELKEADAAKKSVTEEQVKVEKNVVRVAQEVGGVHGLCGEKL